MGHLPGCECIEFGCPPGLHTCCVCQHRRHNMIVSYMRMSMSVQSPVALRVTGLAMRP